MTPRIRDLAFPIVLALVTAACGGSKSPVAPSDSPAAATGSTAVITGSVKGAGASPMTMAGDGQPMTGVTVTVIGTAISSTVDSAGVFNLVGVPTGDIQIRFSGAGVDATIAVTEVQAAQTITLTITVTGGSATVDTSLRSGHSGTELEGRIESLPPTMPAGKMKVAGRTVATDGSTRIEDGSTTRTLADLEVGLRVHVKGSMAGAELAATLVRIQSTNASIPVTINGVMDAPTGSAGGFEFYVGSRLVKGDSSTQFFGDGSSPASFADLKAGARVEVKGLQRDGYVFATRIHVNDSDDETDDDGDGDNDHSASIHGTLSAIGGTKPNLVLTVGSTTVRTTDGTEVKRRGDPQTLTELRVGQTVHVIGTRQGDGSLIARRIEITDDATGGEFEIEGALGGLQGACPVITFGVNGYTVKTTASTTFEGDCVKLKSGARVQVKGTRHADGSVTATVVKAK
jgi:hypothetical protein